MTKNSNEYYPVDVSPPGDTLSAILNSLGMTQAELAVRMGRPRKTVNEIIKGKTAITAETALQLELVLKTPANFWMNRESHYQEALARSVRKKQLASWLDWLDKLPYDEMAEFGWIKSCSNALERLQEALKFFGVVSPEQWEELWYEKATVSFRKSQLSKNNELAVTAWLRQGEIKASEIQCKPYDENGLRSILKEIRILTTRKPSTELYQDELVELFREVGVAFIVVRRLKNTTVFGASQWLTPTKALIQVSLQYKRDDGFWFSIFHEVAHLLLHSKKTVFVDFEGKQKSVEDQEEEANRYAEEILISSGAWEEFLETKPILQGTKRDIRRQEVIDFAKSQGIAPSIVVGRLMNKKVVGWNSNLRKLRTCLKWEDNNKVSVGEMSEVEYW